MTETEKKNETTEQKLTRLQELTLRYLANGVPQHCAVPARNCHNPATVHVGDCCDTPHYMVTSCEKHIATAVRTVVSGGCEVQVNRLYEGGEKTSLIADRRRKSSLLAKHEKFLKDLEEGCRAQRHPDKSVVPVPDEDRGELIGEYTANRVIASQIERFRNSLEQSQNP
jgi:hypothetical protein